MSFRDIIDASYDHDTTNMSELRVAKITRCVDKITIIIIIIVVVFVMHSRTHASRRVPVSM